MFQLPPGIGDREYGELLRRATLIEATEMAVFAVERRWLRTSKLRLLAHVRPDNSTPEMRLAAVEAFREIVGPQVRAGFDRVVEVGDSGSPPQSCLVMLGRQGGRVVGAAAFIARFDDHQAALFGLRNVQAGRRL